MRLRRAHRVDGPMAEGPNAEGVDSGAPSAGKGTAGNGSVEGATNGSVALAGSLGSVRNKSTPSGSSPDDIKVAAELERRAGERRGTARNVPESPVVLPPLRRPIPSATGAIFDQDTAWNPLPSDYENPGALSVHHAWHLPAPFDRFRLGLRARATLALALGALLIAVLVSMLTYIVARQSFVSSRRDTVVKLALANAAAVQDAYIASRGSLNDVVRRQARQDAISLYVYDRSSQPDSITSEADGQTIEPKDIPKSLDATLDGGANAATQIAKSPNGQRLFVGIRLNGLGDARFYEIADLQGVEDNLNDLGRTLALAALVSALGAALVGRSVSAKVVRPLRNVANAAAEIANGRLDTRLQRSGDADLDPLLMSFNGMAQSLQLRLDREARFASDVSHELRTPLTALSTAAQLLKGRRDEFPERSQRAVDVLVTQTEHFERLVLDLLEISRFDAGAAELNTEVMDLPEFVRQVVAINAPVSIDSESKMPTINSEGLSESEVCLDKRRVGRVVANLLQNAANYGGGATFIGLADDVLNDRPAVRITVDDDGPGVPDDEKEAIFERFRRGHAHQRGTSAPKGTGLGLALVAAHVALHGGRVWVEDGPTGGARFVAVLQLMDTEGET
jgi:two-component system, OmpR family, sensor histidine kinase MtrB